MRATKPSTTSGSGSRRRYAAAGLRDGVGAPKGGGSHTVAMPWFLV